MLTQPQAEERHKDKSCVSVPVDPEATRVSKEKCFMSGQGEKKAKRREVPSAPPGAAGGRHTKAIAFPNDTSIFFSVIFCCEAKAV